MENKPRKRVKTGEATEEEIKNKKNPLTPKERAKLHRHRKQQYLENLKEENEKLKEENKALKLELKSLKKSSIKQIPKANITPNDTASSKSSAFSEYPKPEVTKYLQLKSEEEYKYK